MRRPTSYLDNLATGFLVVSLAIVYLMTMSPGLTWANHGNDGGDLITAAATGGVAHPTGYPVYLLLARVFQWMPIGSLAFRTHLMSALASVISSLIVYQLVIHLGFHEGNGAVVWSGLISALAFGLSPMVWSQAVITEVHALHGLFVALLLYYSTGRFAGRVSPRCLDCIMGLTFGLAMGNHATTILLFPILLAFMDAGKTIDPQTASLHLRSVVRRFAWTGIGLTTYLTLPLKALSHPPVNWGNPVNPGGFMWLVTGDLYRDSFSTLPVFALGERARAALGLLLDQFGLPGLVIGLIGLVFFFKPSRWSRISLWIMSSHTIFAVAYGVDDSFLYLIPAFLCFAAWIGLGFQGIVKALSARFLRAGVGLGSSVILYLFFQAGTHWVEVDASRDLRAEQFGSNVLARVPSQAILFARGDRAVFTMWYFHYALQGRPDVALVATDLLPHEWYQETLRNTYPELILPSHVPFPEVVIASNPGRRVCFLDEARSPSLVCRDAPGPP